MKKDVISSGVLKIIPGYAASCLSAAFIVFAFSSCHKSDLAPSNTDLIAKTWKLTALTINGLNAYSSLQDCKKNDTYIYTKDGNFTWDEGATKCNSTDPQTIVTGTWSFQQNGTLLKMVYPDPNVPPDTFTLTQLSSTTLKLTITNSVNGTNVTLVSTFSPQ